MTCAGDPEYRQYLVGFLAARGLTLDDLYVEDALALLKQAHDNHQQQ